VFLESFRPVVKGTLRGFCRIRFESGLIIDEISLHLAGDDGSTWASPPARPMVDASGVALRDQKTGKVKYAALVTFSSATVRRRWSDGIVAVVREAHPEAFE
jgi:hypothetical protein